MSLGNTVDLWLVRHGETPALSMGVLQGYSAIGLSPTGHRQAQALAERLHRVGVPFDGLWASDLKRAVETAEILRQRNPLLPPLRLDPLLREVDVGYLSGLTEEEALSSYPEEMARLLSDPWSAPRPGGESYQDVAARAMEFVRGLPPGRHLVVTHGGWILALLGTLLRMGGAALRHLVPLPCSLTKVVLPEGLVVSFGDVAHLEAMDRERGTLAGLP